jgi:hypothetical protein
MNEFCVNFERLILGKFAKGFVHALYARKVPSSILGRSMHFMFYLQKMKRAKFRKGENTCFTRQASVV